MTTLLLRKSTHPQAVDNYRVIYEGVEVGSIGIQWGAGPDPFWSWGIDMVFPPPIHGTGKDREDCMVQFKEAWHKFSRNPERLKEYLDIKRDLQRKWRRD